MGRIKTISAFFIIIISVISYTINCSCKDWKEKAYNYAILHINRITCKTADIDGNFSMVQQKGYHQFLSSLTKKPK